MCNYISPVAAVSGLTYSNARVVVALLTYCPAFATTPVHFDYRC